MSKKLGTKRTAVQRLSENMNSIIGSENKRRKLNPSSKQLSCKKLKLKPDPTSLFKQFKTNNNENDNQINADLIVANNNRSMSPKVRPVLKSWIPPLKTNINAEKIFDKLQNSERNIGISNKTMQEINKWSSPSKKVGSIWEGKTNMDDKDSKKNFDEGILTCVDQSSDNNYSEDQTYLKTNYDSFSKEEIIHLSDEYEEKIENSTNMTIDSDNLENGSKKIELTNNSNRDVKERTNTTFSNYDDSGSELDFEFNLNSESKKISNDNFESKKFCTDQSIKSQELKEDDSVADISKNKCDSTISNYSKDIISDNNDDEKNNNEEIIDINPYMNKKTFRNYEIQEIIDSEEKCRDSSENVLSQKLHSSPSTQLQTSTQLYQLVQVIDHININDKNSMIVDSSFEDSSYGISQNICEEFVGEDVKEIKSQKYSPQIDENDAEFFFTCRDENNINLNEYIENKIEELSEQDNQIHLVNTKSNENSCERNTEIDNEICLLSGKDVQSNTVTEANVVKNIKNKNEFKIIKKFHKKSDSADWSNDVTSTSSTLVCKTTNKIPISVEIENKNCQQDFDDDYLNNTQEAIHHNSPSSVEIYELNTEGINAEKNDASKARAKVKNYEDTNGETNEEEKSETSQELRDDNFENKDLNTIQIDCDSQNSNETFFEPLLEESEIISIHSQSSIDDQECVNKLNNSNYNIRADDFEPTLCEDSLKKEKYEDLMECSDDFYNIPMSEVIRIENEYTETKMKDVLKQPLQNTLTNQKFNKNICINKKFQPNFPSDNNNNVSAAKSSQSDIQPLKLSWIEKMNEEKQKLRSLVQEVNKLNNIVLQARQQLWPKQFDSN